MRKPEFIKRNCDSCGREVIADLTSRNHRVCEDCATRTGYEPAETVEPVCDNWAPHEVSIHGKDAFGQLPVESWKQKRPEWCPFQDCQYLRSSQESVCVGRLPKATPHAEDFNTHRFCLHGAKDDGEWTFDLQINKSDVYHIKRILEVVQ